MKEVLRYVSLIFFYALAAIVILWTVSLTLDVVGRLLPDDDMTKFLSVALFDGGTLAWSLVFLFRAKGLMQRAISILAMFLDLVGTILISISSLFLSGQTLATLPPGLGNYVVWGVGIMTAINVVAIYTFHLSSPEAVREIKMQTIEDKITDEAMRQVETNMMKEAQTLAAQIADGTRTAVLANLKLLPDGGVIDGKAKDVPTPEPGRVHVMALDTADETNPTPPPEQLKPRRK